MLRTLKNTLYFSVASYFRFFAGIRLRAWKPRVVVITGSNGKTSTLHLVQAQVGEAARYSFGANSSFGIPFHILGMERLTYSPFEWLSLFASAPCKAFQKPPREKIYVVEADCDRPREGAFLSKLLRPEVAIWLSSARTHSQNFEKVFKQGLFPSIDAAIAHEFGYFLEGTKLALVNGDTPNLVAELSRTKGEIRRIQEKEELTGYRLDEKGTTFTLPSGTYALPYLLPKELFYSVTAAVQLAHYLGISPTENLSQVTLPPGRSSVFEGIKQTTLIDSSYNANRASVQAILAMVKQLPAAHKWAVLGDLIEQGSEEQQEHEGLVEPLIEGKFERIILVGPRLAKYTLPKLKEAVARHTVVESFINPREALEYLQGTLTGEETIVFKGARFLEGIIEHLLAHPEDVHKLCRQENRWRARRKQWSL